MSNIEVSRLQLPEDLLLKLLKEHVEEELKKELQIIVDKIIDECVAKATASLRGSIQQYYDNISLGQTVKVILEKR